MMNIQNSKPINYPRFTPAKFLEEPLICNKGDYVVNQEGCVLLITGGNARWLKESDFLRELNIGFARGKYIGNRDDFLVFTDRLRKATDSEIKITKEWSQGQKWVVENSGQLAFF